VELGQHPTQRTDTTTGLAKIGHFADKENARLFKKFKDQTDDNREISALIHEHLDVAGIHRDSSRKWDGGYVMSGMIGHGDAFVLRDPNGIRPAFCYQDDEVVAVASERCVLQTVFNVPIGSVAEIKPGHALIVKKNGSMSQEMI